MADTRNREHTIMRCGNRPSKLIFIEHKAAWSYPENKSLFDRTTTETLVCSLAADFVADQ
jgi:hypothetical protein